MIRLPLLFLIAIAPAVSAQNSRVIRARGLDFVELKAGDLSKLGPARILVEQRKELSLDLDQVKQLETIHKGFDALAGHFAKEVRQFQHDIVPDDRPAPRRDDRRPANAKDSIERARKDSVEQAKADRQEEEMAAARRKLTDTLLRIRAVYDSVSAEATGVLNVSQRARAEGSLARAADELTLRLRRSNIR